MGRGREGERSEQVSGTIKACQLSIRFRINETVASQCFSLMWIRKTLTRKYYFVLRYMLRGLSSKFCSVMRFCNINKYYENGNLQIHIIRWDHNWTEWFDTNCFISYRALCTPVRAQLHGQKNWSRQLACATHGGERKRSWPLFWSRRLACATKQSWQLFSPTFFCFCFFGFTPSAFHPLRGNSRGWKFVSPNILA